MTAPAKGRRRLDRLCERLARQVPKTRGFLHWVRQPSSRLLRIPFGILLVLGGVFSILPVLGLWMLPLGLLMLAIDVPALQNPVAGSIIRITRWWQLRVRRKRDRQLPR